jgi:hypothetical protein
MPGQSVFVVATKYSFELFGAPQWMLTTKKQYEENGYKTLVECDRLDQPRLAPSQVVRWQLGYPQPDRPTLDGDPPLEPDPSFKKKVEESFQKQKKFKLAASAESADFIFWLQAAQVRSVRPGRPAIFQSESEEVKHFPAAMALVIPADLYRRQPNDLKALSAGAIWQGRTVRGMGSEISMADIVKCFHKQVLKK